MESPAATGIPAIIMGRCIVCKRAFRIEIPADIAERFGERLRFAAPYVMNAAGIALPRCECRVGIRCQESALGLPECGDSRCEGHGHLPLKLAAVKVTYKPEVACGASCWRAKCSNCICSCAGKNHGGMHAQAGF